MAPKHIGETVEDEWTQWRAEHPVRANGGAPPTNEGQLADESWEVSDGNWKIGSIITCFEFQVPLAKPGTAWVQDV